MKVKVTQSCPTLATPWTKARILEWVAISYSRGKGPSSMLGCLSCFLRAMREAVAFFTHWPNLGFRKTKGAQDWRA